MRRLTLIGLVTMATLLLAACGGSSSSAPAATSSGSAAPASGAAAGPVAIKIQNSTFPEASMKAGQDVEWSNLDSFAHTVTFDDGSRSGNVSPGGSFKSTIATAGTYTYHCEIHKSMKGTITVTQ